VAKFAVHSAYCFFVLAFFSWQSSAQAVQSLCASNRVVAIQAQDAPTSSMANCETMEKKLLVQIHDTVARGGFVLLGEVHDNPHHHLLRARLIEHLVASKVSTALVFEHVQSHQQAQLDSVIGRDGTALLDALNWEQSGWPERHVFAPLMDAALASGFPLLAGSPNREEIRAASKRPLAEAQDLPAPLRQALLEELEQSHCGLVPREAFEAMLRAQLTRDLRMAQQLASARQRYGSAVLLAGNGHVRRDRGVPFHLAQLLAAPVLSIAFEEEEVATLAFTPAHWTILTPSIAREEPCLQMRKQFRSPRP
jgi:uncharacterized iron-regulated protein